MFEEILYEEKDKNPKNNWGWTPFHLACYYGQLEIIKLLLKIPIGRSIDLNSKDNNGRTGFHIVCSCGQTEIAELLVENFDELNLDCNAEDIMGMKVRFCLGLKLSIGNLM